MSTDRSVSSYGSQAIDSNLHLLHNTPDKLVVEHLSRLKSDAAVQGAIQTWAQNAGSNVLLILVDMSAESALDHGRKCEFVVGLFATPIAFLSKSFLFPSKLYPDVCGTAKRNGPRKIFRFVAALFPVEFLPSRKLPFSLLGRMGACLS
jgi:hypothetical protein